MQTEIGDGIFFDSQPIGADVFFDPESEDVNAPVALSEEVAAQQNAAWVGYYRQSSIGSDTDTEWYERRRNRDARDAAALERDLEQRDRAEVVGVAKADTTGLFLQNDDVTLERGRVAERYRYASPQIVHDNELNAEQNALLRQQLQSDSPQAP